MTTASLPSSSVSAWGLSSREPLTERQIRVIERAVTVFEAPDSALNWLQSPNASLGGVTPLSLLDTDLGADSVLDTLGSIEHGVFA